MQKKQWAVEKIWGNTYLPISYLHNDSQDISKASLYSTKCQIEDFWADAKWKSNKVGIEGELRQSTDQRSPTNFEL